MSTMPNQAESIGQTTPDSQCQLPVGAEGHRVCPVCRGKTLIEIRGKLQCSRCHSICETCCEGGRG